MNIKGIFCTACLLAFYCIYISSYRFAYNFVVEINDWYYVFCLALTSLFILLLLYYKRSNRITIGFIECILFTLFVVGLFLVLGDFKFLNIHNEFFVNCLTFLCLYIILRFAPLLVLKKIIPIAISFVFLYEVTKGIIQLITGLNNNLPAEFYISGSLENSGFYSSFLVINLPIVLYTINEAKLPAFARKMSVCLLAIAIGLILVCTQARTAIIALFVFIVLLLITCTPLKVWLANEKKRLIYLLMILIAFVAILSYLTGIKAGSMHGRLLILNVCIQNIKAFFLGGVGIGQFSYYYPLWQINYFSTNQQVASKYFLNADESHVAFNEILQIFIETGIAGFAMTVVLLVYLLSVKAEEKISAVLKTTIILIATCSITSYPLHCNAVLFILVYCIALLIRTDKRKNIISIDNNKVASILLLSLIAASAVYSLRYARYVAEWNTLRNNIFKDSAQTVRGYGELLPKLNGNGKFLLEAGEQYTDIEKTAQAIAFLEKSKGNYISFRSFNSTALAYYQANNLAKTIENLELLSNLVPARFATKLQLLNLYIQDRDTAKAVQMGRTILTMAVKKMSPQVYEIKKRAKAILGTLEHNNDDF